MQQNINTTTRSRGDVANAVVNAVVVVIMIGLGLALGFFTIATPLTFAPVAGVVALALALLLLGGVSPRQPFAVPMAAAAGPLLVHVVAHHEALRLDAPIAVQLVALGSGVVAVVVPARGSLAVFTLLLALGACSTLALADDLSGAPPLLELFFAATAMAALWLGAGAPARHLVVVDNRAIDTVTTAALPTGWSPAAAAAGSSPTATTTASPAPTPLLTGDPRLPARPPRALASSLPSTPDPRVSTRPATTITATTEATDATEATTLPTTTTGTRPMTTRSIVAIDSAVETSASGEWVTPFGLSAGRLVMAILAVGLLGAAIFGLRRCIDISTQSVSDSTESIRRH